MLESFGQARTSWARRVVFISSIVVHAGAAIGLLIWSVFHVEELAPPEVTLTFFNAPPPPPPPPPPAGAQKKTQTTKPKIVPTKVHTPTLTEPKPTPKDEPKEEKGGGETGGQVGGVQGGVTGGVVGGVVGAPPPTAPPPPPPPAPVAPKMVPSFVFDKERLSAPDPHLSDAFKDHHPKTTVSGRYRMCVGTDGRLTDVSVQAPLGGTEDDLIIRQLRGTWVYKPQPLPICSVRVFSFVIN